MQINEFLYAGNYAAAHRDAVIHDIASVTAAHVKGVVSVGDEGPGSGAELGGVAVHSERGDISLFVCAVIEPGADETAIKKEMHQRIQAALWNLLDVQAVSIQIELVYRDGVPPALARENRKTIPFS